MTPNELCQVVGGDDVTAPIEQQAEHVEAKRGQLNGPVAHPGLARRQVDL
jgi:hypothetical protein